MKLIGIMPVRNEAWVLGLSARVALMWCDQIIIGLHNCDDVSETIADQIMVEAEPDRITIADLPGREWSEMEHRQLLLDIAREDKATHIALIDSDEVLTGNLLPNIRHHVANLRPGEMLQLPGYNLRGSLHRYHDNGIWGKRLFSLAFQDDPRFYWGGDQFHHREPLIKYGDNFRGVQTVNHDEGGIMHLWGASERRLKAKSAHYKLTERLRWPQKPVEEVDQMYSWAIHGQASNRSFGTPATWTYADVPAEWWASYAHLAKYLDLDADPWQEAACIEIIKEHGPEQFRDLDLFGVV